MSQAAQLAILITANGSQADRVLDKFKGSVAGLGSAAKNAAIAMSVGLAGATAGLVAGLGASVKTSADFQQALANTAAATGATADQMARMRTEALGIGKDTSKSASQAAAAMGELVKAGMSTEQVVSGAARAVVQLAEATGSDVSEMAILVSNSLNTFQREGLKASDVANIIAKAANASAIGTTDLGFALQMVGPVASQAGLTMQDFATAIGIMGNNALRGSDAGTSLKTMLMALTAPSDVAKAALSKLGVSVFDSAGKTREFRAIIGDLEKALTGATDKQKAAALATIFGSDAVRAANILIGEGTAGWDAFKATMAGAPAVAEQSATRLKTLNGQIEQLKGSLETLSIGVGTALVPSLMRLAEASTAGVNWLIAQDWSTVSQNLGIVGVNVKNIAGALLQMVGVDTAKFGNDLMGTINGMTAGLAGFSAQAAQAFFNVGIPAIRSFSEFVINLGRYISAMLENGDYMNDWVMHLPSIFGSAAQAVYRVQWAVRDLHDTIVSFATGVTKQLGDLDLMGMAAKFSGLAFAIASANPVMAATTVATAAFAVAYQKNWGDIRDKVDFVVNRWILPTFAKLADSAKKLLAGDTAGAMQGLKYAYDALAPQVAEAVGTLLGNIQSWVQEKLPILQSRLGEWAQTFLSWIKDRVLPYIGGKLDDLWDAIRGWIGETAPKIGPALLDWSTKFLNWVSTDVLPKLTASLAPFLDGIVDWLRDDKNTTQISDSIAGWTSSLLTWITHDVLPKLGTELAKLVKAMEEYFKTVTPKLAEIGARIAWAIISGINKGLFDWFMNFDAAGKKIGVQLSDEIRKLFGVPPAGSEGSGNKGGGWLTDPNGNTKWIPAMANGGIVTRPTLAMVGERGPEAIVPLGKGGAGGGITLNFNGPVYGLSALEDAVLDMIEAAERRGRIAAGTVTR